MASGANTFLYGIFDIISDSPSSVKLTVPNPNPDTNVPRLELVGLMTGDVTFSAGNTWGTVINDLSNLQDLSALMGSDSMFSWIGASTMCWKGTSPLSISIEFYLINYERGLLFEQDLRTLVKMAAVAQDPRATVGADFKAMVHGGYAPKIFEGNKSFFTVGDITSIQSLQNPINNEGVYGAGGDISKAAIGAIQLKFGHKSKIKNLLLSKISVTESNIEVADIDGDFVKPLYYRVSAQFTGVRPLITTDVDEMFDSIGK